MRVQASAIAPVPSDLGVDGGVATATEGGTVMAEVLAKLPTQAATEPIARSKADLRCDYSELRQSVCNAVADLPTP